jgi:oxygen-independent coproporphyrinogen-3 oxidase
VYSKDILGNQIETPVADWPTKRDWVKYAFETLQEAGYSVSSAYTLIKDPKKVSFSYRDNLWKGADLLATGIASFGHVSGVHYQNLPEWEDYLRAVLDEGRLPIGRALTPTPHQLLVREVILQLKRGYLDSKYFQDKFGVDIQTHWAGVWQDYSDRGYVQLGTDKIRLTTEGMLRVDGLLPAFFEAEHQGVRYT